MIIWKLLACFMLALSVAAVGGADDSGGAPADPQAFIAKYLSGKHLVFVGDSLTRYQYISLATFVEYGQWPGNSDVFQPAERVLRERAALGLDLPPTSLPSPNPIWEKGFKTPDGARLNWKGFNIITNAIFSGREVCDCWWNRTTSGRVTVENRYYHSPQAGVTLTYVQWLGKNTLPHGHVKVQDLLRRYFDGQLSQDLAGCDVGRCEPPFEWDYTPGQLLMDYVAPMRPTAVIANAGAWAVPRERSNFWKQLAEAGAVLSRKGTLAIWRATTPRRQGCKAGKRGPFGARMPFALALTKKWIPYLANDVVCSAVRQRRVVFQADGLHLTGDMYRDLNIELLELIHVSKTNHRQ